MLTVLGVVVLDFSADATEGPIRAYLLDVVDSEEQDMALNIHAFSAGERSCPALSPTPRLTHLSESLGSGGGGFTWIPVGEAASRDPAGPSGWSEVGVC